MINTLKVGNDTLKQSVPRKWTIIFLSEEFKVRKTTRNDNSNENDYMAVFACFMRVANDA